MKIKLNLKWASIIAVAVILIGVISARVIEATADIEPTLDVDQLRQRDGVPVEVTRVQPAPLVVRRSFTGSVRGIRSATVRAATGDEILEIPVRVGQRVSEDAVVVRQSSQGSRSSVDQSDAAFQQAQRTMNRLRPLYEKGAISEQSWDEALTSLRVAESNLETARRAIVLTSPISGTITDIMVTPGTFPEARDPLLRISDLSRVQVLISVSPEQGRELALGQTVLLPNSEVRGQVTRIALQADPENRLLEVEFTFPEAGGLVPGTFSTVEVIVMEKESTIAVPRAALRDGQLWVVDSNGVAHHLAVEAGLRSQNRVEIISGLQPGDQVVVAGSSLLTDGVRTRIVGG